MNRPYTLVILSAIFVLVDLYTYQGLKVLIQDRTEQFQSISKMAFWAVSLISLVLIWVYFSQFPDKAESYFFKVAITGVFIIFFAKILWVLFLVLDDAVRLGEWVFGLFSKSHSNTPDGISRKNFLVKTGGFLAAGLGTALTYGVTVGSHHYKLIRQKVPIKGLDPKLESMKIVQISDIHSGSFWNKRAVQRGIDLIKEQKADLVLFTGDLVNNVAEEFLPYEEMFAQIQAPLGVYSVLGNHDYAEYMPTFTAEDRAASVGLLETIYKRMGWDLLRNQQRELEFNGAKFHLLGIDNWGAKGGFPKYGKMSDAVQGVDRNKLNLLMSHDPSHWKAQVLPEYQHVDLTFSGHTHGMQLGIETAGFKWSPVKYFYKEWAGLYTEGEQKLYVNRGFGYLGYPGRLGIRPEVTVIELVSA